MRIAKKKDKALVCSILATTFRTNPTFEFLIRNPARRDRYSYRIAEYAFDTAFPKGGVLISDNNKGVAICYRADMPTSTTKEKWAQLKLLVRALAFRRIHKIFKHLKTVEMRRPKDGHYLYFWFFGVHPTEMPKKSARELNEQITHLSVTLNLDIYAETTMPKNRIVYERFGFEVYDEWTNPDNDITVFFMRKVAKTA